MLKTVLRLTSAMVVGCVGTLVTWELWLKVSDKLNDLICDCYPGFIDALPPDQQVQPMGFYAEVRDQLRPYAASVDLIYPDGSLQVCYTRFRHERAIIRILRRYGFQTTVIARPSFV